MYATRTLLGSTAVAKAAAARDRRATEPRRGDDAEVEASLETEDRARRIFYFSLSTRYSLHFANQPSAAVGPAHTADRFRHRRSSLSVVNCLAFLGRKEM
jgi:hypothetical protein